MTINLAHDWLNEHGDYLYRFALARLRDPHQAEDAVQDTMLAAIKSSSFEDKSSARTWLTGILKHKIIDLQRKHIREQAVSDIIDLDASDTSMDDFFDKNGHWLDKPQTLEMPENALEQKQFLSILSDCMDKLPAKLAAIFTMRDLHETENEAICKELNITATNAWVMLYRARMGLRKCLEMHWLTG
ncbi:sigma-70 family RNA polymerase sigma factor [Citrobacter portucalensis]|uniref:sigma-70 family RNA polymerase sigma factor n=1 Tax=Citrobacter portucalensis TaxID=1639133 RepID=UPI001F14AF77|nr:sigma-70 family RNA polymerase sigma factor [Citrobacter portucalensis]|tara:strand:+ start:749 stop:1309 length:561 start_codon:yes stop_codon:yes gene_type:complete